MSSSQLSRLQLMRMAFVRLLAGFVILLAMLLLPAGTLAFWEAWAYMAVLFLPVTLVLAYLLRNDPGLLERRMRMKEKEAEQGLVVKVASVCLLFVVLLPGLDHRFDWSNVPVAAVVVADVLVLLGYALVVLVFRENSYASRIIEVEQNQHVVTTGPYAIVRHPMYVGVIVMYVLTPVALGSWWAVIPALPLVPILVARIWNEEKVLAEELVGYQEYMRTTRYRLVPGVW
jgi:protein-S-isoprenylcysteine O-methyltransferase Ste14